MPPTVNFAANRAVTTPGGSYPTVAADWVGDFRRRIGFCAGAKDSPIVDEPTTAMDTMLSYLSPVAGSDIGLLRIGRVATSGATRTAQRACAVIAKDRGIKLVGQLDDYGTPTPATRLTEVLNNWQGQALALFNRNEVQRYWSMAQWPDYGLLPLDSTEEMCSKENAVAEMGRLKTARDANAPTLPIATPSMASKGVYAWYQALQDIALALGKNVSTLTDWIELHDYPGGWEPSNGDGTLKTLQAAQAAFGIGRTTILSETGYQQGGAQNVPVTETAVYYPRLFFENLYNNGYSYVTAFNIVNAGGLQYGVFYNGNEAGHTKYEPKPAADCLANLFTLYADTAGSYSTTSLPAIVTPDTGVSSKLHQASDGTYRLAIWRKGARVWDPGAQTSVDPGTASLTITTRDTHTFARYVPRTSGSAEATTTGKTTTVTVGADLIVLKIT